MRIMTTSLSAMGIALGMSGAAMAQSSYNSGADDTGLYLGGGYSFIDVETDNDIGDSTNALTGRVGYRISPFISVETEASFGIDEGDFDFVGDEDDFDFDDNDDADVDDVLRAQGDIGVDYLVGVYARGVYPVTERLDISARGGYAFIEVDSTLATFGGNEIEIGGSESGFAFGAGAEYALAEAHAVRLDYTRYEFDDSNADGVTVAYNFRF